MKTMIIQAFKGLGKEKTSAGERTVEMPENVDEALELFGAEDTLAYITASYTIEIQRQIRAGVEPGRRATFNKLLAFAKANPNSEVAKELAAAGVVMS